MSDGPLVTIAEYAVRGDAVVAAAVLASAGIRSSVIADDEGGLSPGFFADHRVRLVVDVSNGTDAVAMLFGIPPPHVEVVEAMVAHARQALPHEACGLLGVDASGSVKMVYCLTNIDRSPHRFTIDPTEHFGALRHAERNGWDIGGSFHSHPRGPARLSRTDIDRSFDPDWLHVVVSMRGDRPEVAAYTVEDGEPSSLGRWIGAG